MHLYKIADQLYSRGTKFSRTGKGDLGRVLRDMQIFPGPSIYILLC